MFQGLTVSIGGTTVRFEADQDIRRPLELSGAYQEFLSHSSPDLVFHVVNGKARFDIGAPAFETVAWALHKSIRGTTLAIRRSGDPPHRLVTFDADFEGGDVLCYEVDWLRDRPVALLAPPTVEVMFHVLLTQHKKGMLLHASAVGENGEAILFNGFSGAGKSTMIRLWQQFTAATLLSDDRIIVREHEGVFRAYGTPWHGSVPVAAPESFPLSKIFIVSHASKNAVQRLTPAQAARALLVRSFPPFWGAEQMTFTLELLDELVHQVPCYELGYAPTRDVIEYVRCVI